MIGQGPLYEKSVKDLSQAIQLSIKHPPLTFCGRRISQAADFSVTVDQKESVACLQLIDIPKGMRQDQALNEEQVTELRRAVG
eukprot:2482816-Amphidinium_carterae.1